MEPQWDESSVQPQGARCAQHSTRSASTVCSRCGNYACGQCRRVGGDGLEYCSLCIPRMVFLAERSDRFWANLVDQLVLGLPWLAALVVILLFAQLDRPDRGIGLGLFLAAAGTLAVAGYQLHLVAQSGQSIGKRMRGIRVVRSDGSPASLGRIILLRNVVPSAINAACGLFSLIDALFIFQDDRRCLHDQIADTKVVKVSANGR
ncbi:RDD family protein [Stigmatella sp. ncwal1]|uniref:RDD family protein n=1 Tax=Stigmatella ashevillensis TaxID=2995309 RepID=A0ABT5DIS4_9BACT|nr:RDD family protein [Stigmatella ashevillena]MDC0713561.1 RDD family protein [Stigmatella ashevillena]